MTDYSRNTVSELKVELRRRKLKVSGRKQELIERLTQTEAPPEKKVEEKVEKNRSGPESVGFTRPEISARILSGAPTSTLTVAVGKQMIQYNVDPNVTILQLKQAISADLGISARSLWLGWSQLGTEAVIIDDEKWILPSRGYDIYSLREHGIGDDVVFLVE